MCDAQAVADFELRLSESINKVSEAMNQLV
jgi:hypothetical protein